MVAYAEPPTAQPEASTSKQSLYQASTQFRNWRFSVEGLAHLRGTKNEVAVEAIRKKIETTQPGTSPNLSFLTPDEEVLLVKYYLARVRPVCILVLGAKGSKDPSLVSRIDEVSAVACSYVKRFYLRNTVMDWHPLQVMFTATFIAMKTCDVAVSVKHWLVKMEKKDPAFILELEFLVAQSLSFEFTVWTAHRALWGIWLDVQALPNVKLSRRVLEQALETIRKSSLTDAEFVYTPSQIALAAFAMVEPDAAKRWHESKNTESHPMDWNVIEDAKSMIIAQGDPPSKEVATPIDLRLRQCRNPEKDPGSAAHKAKLAEDERKAEEKRQAKAAMAQKAMESEGDPFASKPLVDYDDADDDDDD